MRSCTWVECTAQARHKQISEDGQVWADLCETHDNEFAFVEEGVDIPALCKAYIRAQGGAEKAAQRMLGKAE